MEWNYEKAKKFIENSDLKNGEVFINNKNNNEYIFDCIEIHSETLEFMVSYYNNEGIKWTRPYDLFFEKFTKKDEC